MCSKYILISIQIQPETSPDFVNGVEVLNAGVRDKAWEDYLCLLQLKIACFSSVPIQLGVYVHVQAQVWPWWPWYRSDGSGDDGCIQ